MILLLRDHWLFEIHFWSSFSKFLTQNFRIRRQKVSYSNQWNIEYVYFSISSFPVYLVGQEFVIISDSKLETY